MEHVSTQEEIERSVEQGEVASGTLFPETPPLRTCSSSPGCLHGCVWHFLWASSISCFSSSMCWLYSSRELQIASLKWSIDNKIWKERQDVLNLKKVATGQTVHGLLDIFLLLNHMTSDLQPQLLPQLLVILWKVGARLGQIYINLKE